MRSKIVNSEGMSAKEYLSHYPYRTGDVNYDTQAILLLASNPERKFGYAELKSLLSVSEFSHLDQVVGGSIYFGLIQKTGRGRSAQYQITEFGSEVVKLLPDIKKEVLKELCIRALRNPSNNVSTTVLASITVKTTSHDFMRLLHIED